MSRGNCLRSVQRVGLVASMVAMMLLVACEREQPVATAATRESKGGAATQPAGFNGVFHSTVDGARSVVNLSEREGRVVGMIDTAAIVARANGEHAAGELKDPGTGMTTGNVDMALDGDQLILAMSVINPETGQQHAIPQTTYSRGAPPPVDVQLDAHIVGRWRYAWSDVSDGGSGHVWLVLHPDGSVQLGRSVAGADVETALAGIGSRDDAISGRWRTSDRMLHVMQTGSARWSAFARYEVEGDRLVLTYNNGSQQTYKRQ